jgi:serine/threonine-protein kinase HipA
MGALVFEPAMASTEPASKEIEIDSLVEMAQLILDERARLTTEIDTDRRNDDAMRMLFQVGTSAGGARAKALVAVNKDRTQIRSGQVDAPKGFEHYLLKFDGVDEHKTNSEVFGDPKGYGRMEYAYYLMAKNIGIDIQPSELLIDGPRAHFMTRRFDRKGNTRIHYVSLCAMDHADYKKAGSYSYEQLLTVARKLKLPRKDVVEIFRRMVFNVVARNHDDHTKNFGFTLNDRKSKWRLSPAFDLAYSYKKDSPWVNAHQMTITGKRDNFTHEDLLVIAGIIPNFNKKAKEIVNEVTDIVSDWDRYSKKADVPKGLSKEIKKNHRLNLTDK